MNFGGFGSVFGLAIRATIRAYQLLIRPILPPSCRFYPSCSHYAAEAVALHGPAHGTWLAMRRLLRCHPWGVGGYDPVPSEPSR
jgi:putative membrane protein insertion efficiency factor